MFEIPSEMSGLWEQSDLQSSHRKTETDRLINAEELWYLSILWLDRSYTPSDVRDYMTQGRVSKNRHMGDSALTLWFFSPLI